MRGVQVKAWRCKFSLYSRISSLHYQGINQQTVITLWWALINWMSVFSGIISWKIIPYSTMAISMHTNWSLSCLGRDRTSNIYLVFKLHFLMLCLGLETGRTKDTQDLRKVNSTVFSQSVSSIYSTIFGPFESHYSKPTLSYSPMSNTQHPLPIQSVSQRLCMEVASFSVFK